MIYAITGRRELGKSTLALYLALKSSLRVLFDPRGMFRVAGPAERASTPAEIKRWFDDLHDPPEGIAPTGQLVIFPSQDLTGAFEQMAHEVAVFINKYPTRKLAVLVDECRFVPKDVLGRGDFDWILRTSIRENVNVLLTAHRPVDLTPDVRGIADAWCLFQMVQAADLELVREQCGDDIAERLPTLKPYEFILWDDTRAVSRVVTDAAAWFVPLTRTVRDTTSESTFHGEPVKKNLFNSE